ncbi:MAG: DUF4256 domain-containing protein [Weeksellaceae bacterium]|nr:DUF4256 domain-containing protein [Weeksellaceae bacterium]
MKNADKQNSAEDKQDLMTILQERFSQNLHRHEDVKWELIEKALSNKKLNKVVQAMEDTGGEPDVMRLATDKQMNLCFVDFTKESPSGRRSLCYDDAALQARKQNKPAGSAMNMAQEIGITLLDEKQYRQLQEIENVDTKTSSWLYTPDNIRSLKGAIFGDHRYDTTFVYHNGAESYYAARGFRGFVVIDVEK